MLWSWLTLIKLLGSFLVFMLALIFSTRIILWNELIAIYQTYNGGWLIGGGFNEVLQARDKLGGNHISNSRTSLFRNCLDQCNMLDLGF